MLGFSACDTPVNTDNNNAEPKIEQFFSFNPDSTGPLLEVAIDTLRNRQTIRPFAKDFIKKYGIPVWQARSAIYQKGRPVFLVPVVAEAQKKVTGIIVISLEKQQPVFHWIPRGTAFDDPNLPDKKHLEGFMLMYEKIIFGEAQTEGAKIDITTERSNVNLHDNVAAAWIRIEYCYNWSNETGGGVTCVTDYVWVGNEDEHLDPGPGGGLGGGDDDGQGDDGPGGPGDGGNSNSNPHIVIESTFVDNECLSSVYTQAGAESTYDHYLERFFGEKSVADLYLSVGETPNNPDATAVTHLPTEYYIEIEFNPANLDYPKLEIAGSLIHELIHAEMFRKLLSAAQQGQIPQSPLFIHSIRNDFPGLFDYYTRYKDWQHEQMAAHYRDVIEQALREFNNSYPDYIYEAYAWNGLMGTGEFNYDTYLYTNSTDAWKSLSKQKRENLVNKIFNFRANHSECSG